MRQRWRYWAGPEDVHMPEHRVKMRSLVEFTVSKVAVRDVRRNRRGVQAPTCRFEDQLLHQFFHALQLLERSYEAVVFAEAYTSDRHRQLCLPRVEMKCDMK